MRAEPLVRRLAVSRPLDLVATLHPFRRGRGDPAMHVENGVVWRAARGKDGVATMRLAIEAGEVVATAWGEGAAAALDDVPALVGELDDSTGFIPRHRIVEEVWRRHPGLRIGRTGAVVDAVVAAVLGQRVTALDAHRAWARLTRALGEPAPGPLALLVPARPDRLAPTPWWTYHTFGVERRRAEVLRAVGARAARLAALATAPPEVATSQLCSIAGIGPWTAAVVAAEALGDPDAVPVGDYNLPNLVSWALAREPRGDDDRMLALLEPYRGHRGRVLRLLLAAGIGAPRRGPRMPDRDIARL